MSTMSGAEYIAGFLNAHGVTHVFYIEAILRRTLVEMEKLGIRARAADAGPRAETCAITGRPKPSRPQAVPMTIVDRTRPRYGRTGCGITARS